jgi:luciferase family oxidoreductase group 1
MIPYSFLDLAHVCEGSTISETFEKSVKTAQLADRLGFTRYWFAEHHNMKSVASSATSVLIGHIAGKTQNIRVGSGGIMLPNHSPLVIAEHFGTLASLYPNRIDLGLGRAPGTDQLTAFALNPHFFENSRNFPQNVKLLQQYLSSDNHQAKVRAFPGEGTEVPIWILGSSTDSAYLASSLGLPYAFASHFAPAQMHRAFEIYRQEFNSIEGETPTTLSCVNVIIADTIAEANRLATSFYRMFLGIIRDERNYMQPPIDSMDGLWNVNEEAHIRQMTSCSFIGTKETVKREISRFIEKYGIDEIMISAPIYDLEAKLHSIQLFSELMNEMH